MTRRILSYRKTLGLGLMVVASAALFLTTRADWLLGLLVLLGAAMAVPDAVGLFVKNAVQLIARKPDA